MELLIISMILGVAILAITLRALKVERSASGEVKVHRVLDGDTVIVGSGWRKQRIRLASIDCPEGGQQWGRTATAGLIKLIGGKAVKVEAHAKDKYGRVVATLYVFDTQRDAWVNVNMRMVAKGHAWVYRSFLDHLSSSQQGELYRLERWARDKRVGLWRHSNPIPPWQWRQIK